MDKYILRENETIMYGIESQTNKEGEYSIDITIPLISNDNLHIQFSKTINVINNNNQTGYEVDKIRLKAIQDYLIEINK